MTTWNQRRYSHRHGDMVHAHIKGYTCHEHDNTGHYIGTDDKPVVKTAEEIRRSNEALGFRLPNNDRF